MMVHEFGTSANGVSDKRFHFFIYKKKHVPHLVCGISCDMQPRMRNGERPTLFP